jgi:hypothetical protein
MLLTTGALAGAGTIDLGRPIVNDQRYEIPVILRGAEGQASAMDFTLEYDPAVFRPVSVSAGPAALQANKQIMANSPTPGSYIVVMSGINQNTVTDGEVARVTLERIGETRGSRLRVARPTLAAPDGNALPVSGGSRNLGVSGGVGGEETPPGEESKPPAPTPAPVPGQGDGKGAVPPAGSPGRIGIDASAIPQELGERVIAKRPETAERSISNVFAAESGASAQPLDSSELALSAEPLADAAERETAGADQKALDGLPRSSQNKGAGAGSAADSKYAATVPPSRMRIESSEVQNGKPMQGAPDLEHARTLRQVIVVAGVVAAMVLAGGGLWTVRQRFFR